MENNEEQRLGKKAEVPTCLCLYNLEFIPFIFNDILLWCPYCNLGEKTKTVKYKCLGKFLCGK